MDERGEEGLAPQHQQAQGRRDIATEVEDHGQREGVLADEAQLGEEEVTAPDDIVTRLRRDCMSLIADEAADEIERLREQLRLANIDNFNTTSEVETMRAERDEARRMFCDQSFGNKHAVACELGWICYPEPANAP